MSKAKEKGSGDRAQEVDLVMKQCGKVVDITFALQNKGNLRGSWVRGKRPLKQINKMVSLLLC